MTSLTSGSLHLTYPPHPPPWAFPCSRRGCRAGPRQEGAACSDTRAWWWWLQHNYCQLNYRLQLRRRTKNEIKEVYFTNATCMKMTFAQMTILFSDTVTTLLLWWAKSRAGRGTRVKPRLAYNAYKSPMPPTPSVHKPQLALLETEQIEIGRSV